MANAINSLSYNNNTYVFTTPYGSCSTAAGTAAKTVSVDNFSLETSARVSVKFTYANTAGSPTLNVNSTGAKAIYWHGAALPSSQYWEAGAALDFIYNGTQWELIGIAKDNNTTYTALKNPNALTIQGNGTTLTNGTYDGSAAKTVNITPTSIGLGNVENKSSATIRGELTKSNVTTALGYTPPTTDTNTTYSAGTGISLSGTTFSNSGVRSIATGSSNGTISVNTNGTSADVAVKGLGSAAYTASTAYATAAQGTLASNAMPKSGGTFTGNVGLGANTLTIGGATVSYNSSSNIFDVSAASGNSATVSVKLGSKTVGSATQPIYFNAGTPTPCTYTLGKSVPSDAKFTDTTYTSLKNPYSLTIQGNGTTLTNGTYDGSAAKTVNITPASIGALSLSGGSLTGAITVPRGTAYQSLDTAGAAKPLVWISSEDAVMLGATATDSAHSGNTQVNAPNGSVYLKCKNDKLLQWYYYTDSSAGTKTIFAPSNNAEAKLGSSSYRWYKLYASTACSTSSDEREKSDIMSIDDYPVTYSRDGSGNVFEKLFDKLSPKTYTLNVENSGELHIGFIAQDIANSLEELGLSTDDVALIDHNSWVDEETGEEKDRYGLTYEEFIALNTYMIQKQKAKIEEQQTQINSLEERVAKLEKLVNGN